jgi:hypothetical protein
MSKHSMRRVSRSVARAQRLGQRARARLLRALFGQQARQRDLGALLRQLQPLAALPLRLEHQVDAVPHCSVSAIISSGWSNSMFRIRVPGMNLSL